AIAQHLLEEECFGADWAAYRNAQRLHFDGKFLDAYFAYLELRQEFKETVYAEAATCYLIEILTKLADEDNVVNQKKRVEEAKKELVETKERLALSLRLGESQQIANTYQTRIKKLERKITLWQNTPAGVAALEKAERETLTFFDTDKNGLYRGEAMLNVGLCYLEVFYEIEKGEEWLTKADKWFDDVRKLDVILEKFQVPDKARGVSQAPKTERFTDEFNNVKMSQLQSGQVFNRRECSWYLSAKQKSAVLMLGLIAYAKKDYETAKTQWERLYEVDEYFKKADGGQWWSTAKRLLWDIENTPGCFFATKEEMTVFSDARSRFVLLVAEVELEQQDYPAAEKKFRRLLRAKAICSSRERSAYCTFALATALKMQFKTEEAVKLFEQFAPNKPFDKTPTAPRVLIQWANQLTQNPERKEDYQRGLKMYAYIVQCYSKTEYADQSQFSIAMSFYAENKLVPAKEALNLYLKKFPKGKFVEVAKELLKGVDGKSAKE
ncbi:MAG: hypothetical protein LBU65_15985, partial [Planctomycetaceae bacterium]|nr:hypothetical protein [Planctomycetaceae bacterium]